MFRSPCLKKCFFSLHYFSSAGSIVCRFVIVFLKKYFKQVRMIIYILFFIKEVTAPVFVSYIKRLNKDINKNAKYIIK